MRNLINSFVKNVTPPIIFRGLQQLDSALYPVKRKLGRWGEKQANWYDNIYESNDEYHHHYSESCYYFLWTVLVDRMISQGAKKILDLGCGPGQFGSLLFDKGFRNYCGVDISAKCVEIAKQKCPDFEFIVANVHETDVLESRAYDCLVALEFLEHVQDDLKILKRVKTGTKFFGTVPDFPYISHVRHFTSSDEVRSRYSKFFTSLRVDSFVRNSKGSVFFILDGIKI